MTSLTRVWRVDWVSAYAGQLLNIMLVAHHGTEVPALEPLARPGGGWGEVYCRKAEIWVDPTLNPGACVV